LKAYTIDTGLFKLDGGAMFGIVPKSIWNKLNPADENNMCTWAMRCLLVQINQRLILIDNGIGSKQDERFFKFYYLHGNETLISSLRKHGFEPDEITDVFLTHLHFDHCGGGVEWNKDRTAFQLTFPNATYWTNEAHWNYALSSNQREKPSFLKENLLPMYDSGHLQFIEEGLTRFLPEFDIIYTDGHTGKQMIPVIRHADKTLIYCADLIPSKAHIPIHYVMGYDVRPLLTMEEKKSVLNLAIAESAYLFFEHDPIHECVGLTHTEKGIQSGESFLLSEVFKS
jgi:glyoxylase-like metal-dependent hydrolase (beta-lactamase superfamily II)